jgi:hypothetical protein
MSTSRIEPLSVQVMLEEYKAIRAEIILCLERRITLLSYGLTAIGILTAAGVAALTGPHPSATAASPVFLLAIPFSSTFVLDIWFTETQRVRRGFQWEHSIRSPRPDPHRLFTTHYLRITGYFVITASCSVVAGGQAAFEAVKSAVVFHPVDRWIASCAVAAMLGALLLIRAHRRALWLEANYNQPADALDLPMSGTARRVSVAWLAIVFGAVTVYLVSKLLGGSALS